MSKTIDFSTNWNNKLFARCFTTIRLADKYEIGETVEVWLRLELLGRAVIVDKRRLTSVDALNEWICMIDTGYSKAETIKILAGLYKDVTDWSTQPVYLYLVRYIGNTIGNSSPDATIADVHAPGRVDLTPQRPELSRGRRQK
jgi:hypothetical protein